MSATSTGPDLVGTAAGGRKLVAVVYADMVGYSRLIGLDDGGTLRRLRTLRRALIDPAIREHGGRVVQTGGDSLLVAFDSIDGAVRCAVKVQQQVPTYDGDQPLDRRIRFRVGINLGDVIAHGTDLHGNGVNVAARLETVCPVGGICVSRAVRDHVHNRLDLPFESLGALKLKNIARPVEAFVLRLDRGAPANRRHFPNKYVGVATSAFLGFAALSLFVVGDRQSVVRDNSIIVMPFRNLSGNTEDDYFADAITDNLTTDLSRLPRAFVISSATAQTYKGRATDARTVGRECGAHYLLEGSIRRIDQTVRINAQLIDTQTGAHMWAERFTRVSTNLQDLEDAITGRIGSSLKIELVKAEVRHIADSLAADHNPLDERLHAMALVIGPPTQEKYLRARQYIEESLEKDQNSAESWTYLATLLLSDYLNGWNNATLSDVDRAEEAYKRALAIDPSFAAAHYAAGLVHRVHGDHDSALYQFEKAIALNSNLAVAHAQMANTLVSLGRARDAVIAGERAVTLSPHDPSIGVFYWVIGRAYFIAGDYRQTVDWLKKSTEERSNLWFNRVWLISAYALTGRDEEARVTLDAFKLKFPGYTLPRITDIYTKESRFNNDTMKAATTQLFEGLKRAGFS